MIIMSQKTLPGYWAEVLPAIDLETIPLEIKTNSTAGSGVTWVDFYTALKKYVGGVRIRFYATPVYYIQKCRDWTNFPVNLPTEVEKVWRITLNRNSGIRLLIHCNNVLVLNFLMSHSTCSDPFWSHYWSKNVQHIEFDPRYDTASKYFRAGQPGTNA